jgi:hypothetical protein
MTATLTATRNLPVPQRDQVVAFEQLGFRFGPAGVDDPRWRETTVPDGWFTDGKRVVLDPHGRIRALIWDANHPDGVVVGPGMRLVTASEYLLRMLAGGMEPILTDWMTTTEAAELLEALAGAETRKAAEARDRATVLDGAGKPESADFWAEAAAVHRQTAGAATALMGRYQSPPA